MQKMENPADDNLDSDQDIIRAEVVEVMAGAPWQWQEVRPVRPRRRWRLPLLLFVATCLSTWLAGIDLKDGWWAGLLLGLRYAVPVMTILICHEMGHFLQAWRYGVYASLPYFIPMPISPIGTFGAVIAMEPRMGHRRALFDIGITGPLAGLVPTLIFCVVGLHYSKPEIASHAHEGWSYGAPLLFRFLAGHIVPQVPEADVLVLDPMAFAGWVGLLITSLNLIPIGQLDGGHIVYSLFGKKSYYAGIAAVVVLMVLGVLFWQGWLFWALIAVLIGLRHPPIFEEERLDLKRKTIAFAGLVIFVLSFTPAPLSLVR